MNGLSYEYAVDRRCSKICHPVSCLVERDSSCAYIVNQYDLLSPEDISEVLLFKARCCKETGDAGAALGYLEESGLAGDYPSLYSVLLASSWRLSESREWALKSAGEDSGLRDEVMRLFKKAPSLKKEGTAAALSFIPPVFYSVIPGIQSFS